MPYRLATSQYMHHDLDTRDIVAYAQPEINTHFSFLPGQAKLPAEMAGRGLLSVLRHPFPDGVQGERIIRAGGLQQEGVRIRP